MNNCQDHIHLLKGGDQAGIRSPAGLRWPQCGCRGHHIYKRHAQIFYDDGTDGILLVDCNIQITCPEMSISSTRTEVPRVVHLWRGRDLIPGRDNTG